MKILKFADDTKIASKVVSEVEVKFTSYLQKMFEWSQLLKICKLQNFLVQTFHWQVSIKTDQHMALAIGYISSLPFSLVEWLSGRTSVSDRRNFTGLHLTCS